MKRLVRLFSRSASTDAAPTFDAPLAPDERLAVVGDIHGTDGLLAALLERIAAQGPARLVFVGDYVDRGEDSAGVLARLHALSSSNPRAVFLAGNHEAMMLGFLDDPEHEARRWLRNGGLQTLASFGIGGLSEVPDAARAVAARDALAAALGPERLAWLRGLPTRFTSGNVAVVHAGADPGVAINIQPDATLLWGHPAFATRARGDGVWVVHGHTITAEIAPREGRIGVDTGAYANGRLSAALIGPGSFEPVSVTWRDTRAPQG